MPEKKENDSIQTTRAWTGLLVVFVGDTAIALAAILVTLHLKMGTESVAILTSAFTAIASITTAYFGIRAATNAAQSAVEAIVEKGNTSP